MPATTSDEREAVIKETRSLGWYGIRPRTVWGRLRFTMGGARIDPMQRHNETYVL